MSIITSKDQVTKIATAIDEALGTTGYVYALVIVETSSIRVHCMSNDPDPSHMRDVFIMGANAADERVEEEESAS